MATYTVGGTDIVVGKKISEGQFGKIFLAKCTKIGTEKSMNAVLKRSRPEKGDLVVETSILKYLRKTYHKNIARMLVSIDDHNIIMRYYPGNFQDKCEDLRDANDFEGIINLAKGILEGLDFLSKRNVVHNDLKSDNIVLDGER